MNERDLKLFISRDAIYHKMNLYSALLHSLLTHTGVKLILLMINGEYNKIPFIVNQKYYSALFQYIILS